MRSAAFYLAFASLFGACNGDLQPVDDTNGTDPATGTGTSSDTGTGSDTGSDTSTGSDTGTTQPVGCDATPTTPAPNALGTCHTAELFCGDHIEHTTVGGSTDYSSSTYEAWQCFGQWGIGKDYSAPERSYFIAAPPGTQPVVTLTTKCHNFTLRQVMVSAFDECPNNANLPVCEGSRSSGADLSTTLFPGYNYMIVVDGIDGAQGAFSLDVVCN